MTFRAVVFDLGGVVLESPLHAINRFEDRCGIPRGSITDRVASVGDDSAWKALETGRLSMPDFIRSFEAELAEAGIEVPVAELMEAIEDETALRPAMLAAIDLLREQGMTVAALTNNWVPFPAIDTTELRAHFDVFVESYREGVNKPDPEIYRRLLDRLRIPPAQIVYLDDIGRNLKPGRALGMTTILVRDPETALLRLGELLGLTLM